jgi:hypothetical protein
MLDTTTVASKPTLTGKVMFVWLLRVLVAAVFFYVGIDKFAGGRVWVRIFDTIGIGQWFRYLTGALQVAGAILVVLRRTFLVGIGLLGCTMVGACIAWLTVLRQPMNMVVPGMLLMMLVVVGAFVWYAEGE